MLCIGPVFSVGHVPFAVGSIVGTAPLPRGAPLELPPASPPPEPLLVELPLDPLDPVDPEELFDPLEPEPEPELPPLELPPLPPELFPPPEEPFPPLPPEVEEPPPVVLSSPVVDGLPHPIATPITPSTSAGRPTAAATTAERRLEGKLMGSSIPRLIGRITL
jgi:hypothetical protein